MPNYQPPVSQLLTYCDCREHQNWANYREDFFLTIDHIPALTAMTVDLELLSADSDSLEVWAPVHAWRALYQFGPTAIAALEPLLTLPSLWPDDDWIGSEIPKVIGNMGELIIPVLEQEWDNAVKDEDRRIFVSECFKELGEHYPHCQAQINTIATRHLENYRHHTDAVNGFLIALLCDFVGREALPLIERVFFEGKLDTFIANWEDVQISFEINDPDPSQATVKDIIHLAGQSRPKAKGFGETPAQTSPTSKSAKRKGKG